MGEPFAGTLRPAGALGARQVKTLAAAILVAATVAGAAHAAKDPVAFVADLSGNASIEGDGKVRFLSELAPGTRLLVGTNAVVVVTYAMSGTEYTARGPGEFTVGDTDLKADRGTLPVKRAVPKLKDPATLSAISRTATASVRMRTLRPEVQGTSPLEYPVDTRVANLRPAFRWRGNGPGQSLEVVDAGGKVVFRGPADSGAVPATLRLEPGKTYRWTVNGATGPLGPAQFATLDAADLARARKSTAAGSFSGRVSHAMLLQELGAGQDAGALWAQLARERPDLPELAALHP